MAWYTTLKTWLCDPKGQGFVAGKNDPCMFVNPRTGLRLAIVVDDIICRGSKEVTEMFYRDLGSRFDIFFALRATSAVPLLLAPGPLRL